MTSYRSGQSEIGTTLSDGSSVEDIAWTESIGTGTDGHGGTYTWDDLTTHDGTLSTTGQNSRGFDGTISVFGLVTQQNDLDAETYTLHDSGGAVTEDEVYHSSVAYSDFTSDFQTVITNHATTSDTYDFEDKGTAPVATGGATGNDNFDNTRTTSETTDYTYKGTEEGLGDGTNITSRHGTSTTSENDQGSETDGTHDSGGDSLSGASSGSDTFTADTGNSDNWTHVASSNSADVAGETSGSSSTVTDTDTGTDSSDDGVIGTDSLSAGTSGGTDNFNDSEDSSDEYNLSATTITALAGGINSGSTSAILTAGGGGGSSDEDQGTDANSDSSSDNFDGTFGDDENWTTNETASSSYDGLGGTTSGGSADDTDSDTSIIGVTGGDSGPISDSFTANDTETSGDSATGSWNIATSPGGAITATGGVNFDDSDSDIGSDSDTGTDSGDGFKQGDSNDVQEHDTETDNADGSDQYKVTADGTDSSSFDLSGRDAGGMATLDESGSDGMATLDESGSDQWTSSVNGAGAVDGSGSSFFSDSDGGSDSVTDSGSGTAMMPISGGTETDNVVLNEISSDNYGDSVTGNTAVDAAGNLSGNESYSSSDSGQNQLTLTDSGDGNVSNGGSPGFSLLRFDAVRVVPTGDWDTASDSHSLHATDGDTYTLTDMGIVTLGPSGTSGGDMLTSHIAGSDSFGGTDAAVVAPSGGPGDAITLSLSGSDAETLDETVTTSNTNGATTSVASGIDSGSDSFDLSDSDATNNYTEDDSDSYDDPIDGPGTATSPSALAPNADASGIQPAGAAPGDTSFTRSTGTPPGGSESPTLSAVSGFFGNLWDRATYVPTTVWANTADSDSSLAGRIYVTAGTTVGSLVGVTQVSDAFAQHDAVDGHEQSTGERIFKGVTGTVQLATLGTAVAGKVTAAVIPTRASIPNAGKLVYNPAAQSWTTAKGLVFSQGSAQGNRLMHVMDHLVPNSLKPLHTIFDVPRNKLVALLDEAWTLGGTSVLQPNGNRVFDIALGRIIGTAGETRIRIVLKNGTLNIITAYPIP